MAIIINEVPRPRQIELARNLSMGDLRDRAGTGLRRRFIGHAIVLPMPRGVEIVDFTPRTQDTAVPGFFHWRQNKSGGTLDRSAVVFRKKGSIDFVNPGPNEHTVSGLRLTRNGKLREFEGPITLFGRKIIEAKKLALKNLPQDRS